MYLNIQNRVNNLNINTILLISENKKNLIIMNIFNNFKYNKNTEIIFYTIII